MGEEQMVGVRLRSRHSQTRRTCKQTPCGCIPENKLELAPAVNDGQRRIGGTRLHALPFERDAPHQS